MKKNILIIVLVTIGLFTQIYANDITTTINGSPVTLKEAGGTLGTSSFQGWIGSYNGKDISIKGELGTYDVTYNGQTQRVSNISDANMASTLSSTVNGLSGNNNTSTDTTNTQTTIGNVTTYIDSDGYKHITTTFPEDGSTLTETQNPDGTSTYTSTNATDGNVNSSASKAQKTNATNTSTDTNNVLGIEAGKLRSGNVDMNTIPQVIISVIQTLLGIAGTVAIFSLIYHAVQMQLNSGITGDSSGVDKAKKGMTGALVGFVIAIAAWFLVTRAVDLLSAVS